MHGLNALNFFFPPFIHHFGHAILRALRKRRPNYLSSVLCCSFPEIAGNVGLQVIVRRAAAVIANRAGHRTRVIMRTSRAGCLPVRATAVGHIVISRGRAAADLI